MKTINKETKEQELIKDVFWKDGDYDCHSGFYYRSQIGKEIQAFESKFPTHKVVGIKITRDENNVEFICDIEGEEK